LNAAWIQAAHGSDRGDTLCTAESRADGGQLVAATHIEMRTGLVIPPRQLVAERLADLARLAPGFEIVVGVGTGSGRTELTESIR
jgi:hypothetical protein